MPAISWLLSVVHFVYHRAVSLCAEFRELKKDFSLFFVGANPVAVDLLDKLLHLDPDKQPSAAEALAHPYFSWLYCREDDEAWE